MVTSPVAIGGLRRKLLQRIGPLSPQDSRSSIFKSGRSKYFKTDTEQSDRGVHGSLSSTERTRTREQGSWLAPVFPQRTSHMREIQVKQKDVVDSSGYSLIRWLFDLPSYLPVIGTDPFFIPVRRCIT